MVSFLTDQGLELTTLEDIQEGIENDLRSALGPGINLLPTELLGQIVGILSAAYLAGHQGMQAVYASQYPSTASGVSLDHVADYNNLIRLPAIPSTVSVVASGTQGTMVPQDSEASVAGNPEALFKTTQGYEIGPGTDEVQRVTFSLLPDAGAFRLIFAGEETEPILHNALALDVQNALNNLNALSDVSVFGNFNQGFSVIFTGQDGQKPQNLLAVGENTLKSAGNNVDLSFLKITPGKLPNVAMEMVAVHTGPTQAPAGTLTVIETPIAGWEAVSNPLDAKLGRNIETDAEFRIRRNLSLANPGTATVEAIRARLLQIPDVKAAIVYENNTTEKDLANRPPKSVEGVVLGGSDLEIAEVLWKVGKAGGIESYGSTTVEITDSQGFIRKLKFSRPVVKEIYILVKVKKNEKFPINGDQVMIQNLLDYAQKNLSIGDDVVTVQLYCPVTDVEGVVDAHIFIGLVDPPISEENIPIQENEIALFDSSRMKVNFI